MSSPEHSKNLILACDFGTSSVKAALIDRQGRAVAHATRSYPLLTPGAGRVEQEPEDWWRALGSISRDLLRQAGQEAQAVAALNICAQMCGLVAVDAEGRALRPCLTWLDTRSAPEARRMTAGVLRIGGYGVAALLRWLWYTNGAPNLAGRDPVSKILWLRDHEPETWQRTAKLLDVKDYLLQRCCHRFVTTPDVAHLSWLMNSAPGRKTWCKNLLDRLAISEELLPEIQPNNEIAGNLQAQAASELGLVAGIPVINGAGDVTASALGAGSLKADEPHLHLGSSAWLGVHLEKRKVDVMNNIGTICSAVTDRYLLVAAQQSGALSLSWAMQVLGRQPAESLDYAIVNDAVLQSPVGARGLLYTPWLLGECVPRTVPVDRGEFFNLSAQHNLADIYRAVMEGIALNIRWAQAAADRYMPSHQHLRAFGGGAGSPAWCQILADCLQLPIVQMQQPQLAGVFGSAMLAAEALGWHSLEEATAMAAEAGVYEPATANRSYYDDAYERFLQYYRLQKGR